MNTPDRHVVVRNFERADANVVSELGSIGTATVHEAIGRRGYLGVELRPIQSDVKIGGTAVTVLSHPGDNTMIHAAVELCGPGDLVVVTCTAPSTHGMFGDLLAASFMTRGVVGLVMDAGVRDTHDLRAMGFPVWTRHIGIQGTVKSTPGSVNVPVSIGGQTINPGDVVCGDDDGVVVVARSEAEWALEQARARIDKEAGTRARLESGELGYDFYGLRQRVESWGVEYVDSADALD